MRLAYFDPLTKKVIQWFDTDTMECVLPDASMLYECSEKDWEKQFSGAPQMLKGGAIVDFVPQSRPVEDARLLAWALIKAERDRRKSQGGVKVGTKWFHSDDASRIQQIGLVMMGASIPANTQWKTMDGSFVTMTQTLAGQIFQTSAANDMAIFAAAEIHKSAMEASSDPASYDFSTGWPKAFGE